MSRKVRVTKRKNWKRWGILAGSGVLLIAATITIRSLWSTPNAQAQVGTRETTPQASRTTSPAPTAKRDPNVVAKVNGQAITRDHLGRECLRHYGKQVLESLVNKQMIFAQCKERGVTVTTDEVYNEVNRLAKRFKLSREQFVGMLLKERGIDERQYQQDIIWPTLALRKLAATRMEVTEEELRIAYEQEYGASIQVRIITLKTEQNAQKVLKLAKAEPAKFATFAKQYSKDINSAPAGGLVQPIRRHVGYEVLENAAFSMRDGQVSDVLKIGGQFLIVKREREIPRRAVRFEQVRERLADGIKETKLQKSAHAEFRKIQDAQRKRLRIVLGDDELRRQYPKVAAFVGNSTITLAQLAEECINRHGDDVLEGLVNHALLAQALAKKQVKITEGDMQAEIARAAKTFGLTKPSGEADTVKWIERITKEQGVSEDVYRRDSVWPSVALKKLVAKKVEVTGTDLKRSFEANYTERVRCLAIVMDNQRRAHEVWAKARDNPTDEFFGDLAEEYSVDTSSRSLRGQIPPIQRHGGRRKLEEAAFALKAGELSGIIHMEDKFVILRCQGRTKPVDVEPAEVRDLLVEDIREKKTRIAMQREFARIQGSADIVNYLDPSKSRRPRSKAAGSQVKLTSGQQPTRR
ncbi:MAG: peptidyl-prolyl cis-trans isomerase [Pirellulales bacterium]|nr:peptidyl-prolyl cis-trans isomerase [Pirellulales bacterium]